MTHTIDLGDGPGLALTELLATRLLIQGSSGSGKTYLLCRLLEQSVPHVQQVIVDPEGEFTYLARLAGHTRIDASRCLDDLAELAVQARERQTSVVLDMSDLDPAAQVVAVGRFLTSLFDVPRPHWYPALVVVDESHLFASADAAGAKADRLLAGTAMANLMCRGRKRGLAGILATQRVAKIAKNVAAEAGNLLVGRTLLDIDMRRSADLVGLPRQSADVLRDLGRGEFLALGPALANRPTRLVVGPIAPRPPAEPEPEPIAPETPTETLAPAPVAAEPVVQSIRYLAPPLSGLYERLAARAGRAEPWPGYLALARETPGVVNAVHAKGLCEALARLGRLRLVATASGVDFLVT